MSLIHIRLDALLCPSSSWEEVGYDFGVEEKDVVPWMLGWDSHSSRSCFGSPWVSQGRVKSHSCSSEKIF